MKSNNRESERSACSIDSIKLKQNENNKSVEKDMRKKEKRKRDDITGID